MNKADWLNLVRTGEWATLDDCWIAAVEETPGDPESLLAVLEALTRAQQNERAAALAWMWLTTARQRCGTREMIHLAGEILLRSGADQLRNEVASLYQEVYADVPGIDALIDASGIRGGKTPRRALRTLDVCLRLAPGSYVVSRTDDTAAQVVEVDWPAGKCVLRTRSGTIELAADPLASQYDPAEANDFRVLTQLEPDRFAAAVEEDPAVVIVGLLRSRGGRMDSDELKHAMTPRYMSTEAWTKWWSRARTALKRHPNVRMEGRNPVTIIYDEVGQSLEDEVREQWEKARTAEERVAVIDSYIREARSRRQIVDSEMLAGWAEAMARQAESHGDHPAEALRLAVVVERLRRTGFVPGLAESPVGRLLANAADPVELLVDFASSDLIHLLLDVVRQVLSDRWPDVFVALLPRCPPAVIDEIAACLLEEGHRDRLQAVIDQVPMRAAENLRTIAWLWCGPRHAEQLSLPPRVELLGRMLTLLGDLARHEGTPPEVLKEARAVVRNAISARKYGVFREALSAVSSELAGTVYRQITRTPGLSQAMVHDLTTILREMFPSIFERPKVEPWEDENAIYTTEAGRQKAEEELNYVVNVKMPENARAIGAAAAHGDLSENSEYKFALEERDLLRARVAKMQNELAIARVIEPHIVPRDRVGVGSRVHVRSTDGTAEFTLTFLGPWDADVERHVYNYRAPLSRRMMGLRVGDTLTMDIDGTEREYRIESVESAV